MTGRTIVVTGSGGGINAAVAARLEAAGHTVIGVDVANAETIADLATAGGREAMIAQVRRRVGDCIDGVVAGAGTAFAEDAVDVVRINYFGAVETIEILYPMLARSSTPRAVIIVSTASLLPISRGTVAACLAGDEQRAVDAARAAPGEAYMSSKYALGQWIRREAVTPRWAGRRMTLNGVSPGVTNTMMIKRAMEMPNGLAMLTNSTPRATPMIGQPEDLAEPIAWLATMDTAYIAGQILWVDGGTEAILRPDIL